MERERDELVGRLRDRIGPADLLGGPEDRVVVLAEPVGVVLAVHLARGGEHGPDPALRSELEHLLAGADVVEERAQRAADDLEHPDRGGKVEDQVDTLHRALEDERVLDAALDERHASLGQVRQIARRSGGQIVHHDDLVAVRDAPIDQMRADEPRAAGDEDAAHRPARTLVAVARSTSTPAATGAPAGRDGACSCASTPGASVGG